MGRHRPVQLHNVAGRRAVYLPGRASLVVLATVLILRSGRAAPTWVLPSSARQTTELNDVSASEYSRRSLLGSSLLSLISASPAVAESPCACCESDWCGCGAKCVDCHAYLTSRGYSLPADLASAVKSRGVSDWAAAVDWQTAEAPQWRPVQKDQVSAGQSLLPGAGRGLFARRALAKGAVLPPYKGQLQTFQTVTRGGAYVWCPQNPSDAAAAFCMDAAADDPENPARLVNAAANEEQCKQVNTEICQLGSILYFRTVQDVPAGTELVTDYGYSYWPDFDSCQLVTASDLMARLEKRSTR
ncbi:PRDM12 [Symbiodinium sp. CCMP2592]|nr:PRDM12 [Symbiodinium sp. CCMP2592]